MGNGTGQRPLSEVSPMAQRRNSPSWNQSSKMAKTVESSSFESPASPRLFWQGRESGSPFQKSTENQAPYDPEASFSSPKRPSIENLKRASRVRNSHMLRDHAQEYDPAQVYVPQRPLATSRSPQKLNQNHAGSQKSDAQDVESRPSSPIKDQASPSKSSLSRASRFGVKGAGFDPESDIWSDIDSNGHRHAKSVTFDAAPPQINEYEMTTPDPSSVASESRDGSYDSEEEDEGDISFDRESSIDRDDSFDASLEDIEKTPVVLPEDWRYMSPSNANDELVKEDEDPFTEDEDDESNSPDPRPSSREEVSNRHSRVESLDSNGERRPLPPLPSTGRSALPPQSSSPTKLAAAFELGSGGQRILPSPPGPASYSKADISEVGRPSMSLEDRLRLMMIQENGGQKEDASEDKASKKEPAQPADAKPESVEAENKKEPNDIAANDDDDDTASEEETFCAPRISRDSILRDIRKSESFMDDSYEYSSQIDSSPQRYMHYDPDVPLPSLENDDDEDDDDDDDTNSVVIKEEDDDDDLYDIPDYYENVPSKESSFRSLADITNGIESQNFNHSTDQHGSQEPQGLGSDDGQATPVPEESGSEVPDKRLSKEAQEGPAEVPGLNMAAIRESLQRPETPDTKDDISEPSTPGSVIRHPVDDEDRDVSPDEESVPDPIATIKAHGAKLKTRPSLTPADLEQMAATRRQVSGQQPPPMPSLTKQNSNDSHHSSSDASEPQKAEDSNQLAPPSHPETDPSQRKSSLMKLDIPFSIQEEESLGFGLDKEFDRVMETQKRGYLMRQNTKVIVASSNDNEPVPTPGDPTPDPRGTRSAGSSPRKASQQTWTTVPWNGKTRRSSIRTPSGIPKKKPVGGPVPPLPGQQSNVQDSAPAMEETEPALNEALDDGEERGRLFVKVVGIKYLDLPLPRGERSYFALTLDNGLHCVTTAWLELGKSAPIGQEFELIVQNDIEFQLTLQMKVDEEKFRTPEAAPASPSRQKASTLSRVFASPRKRKELDMKQQLLTQQQKSKDVNAPVWDRLRTLIARDGSFGRSYVSLSDHEKSAYGRPYTVDVACFNEWATEEQPSSVKSKKSTSSGVSQRRPPYKIGKLELQLLFVPKPKGAKEDDMPKSMNACIREMREAENVSSRSWDGFLSQQGGDCPYWRRRFFKLQGSKLTAFHETTRQPRATINLSKAVKLIDDKSSLVQKETTTRNGGRRKSAFAEEEEGYMFVEEGFRIRFGNGEVIDFYADSAAAKDGWMKVLGDAVGKGTSASGSGQVKPWTDVVLKRERSLKSRRETSDRLPPSAPAPPPVRKDVAPPAGPPAPAPAPPRPRHKHTFSQPETRGAEARRQKTRSLMF